MFPWSNRIEETIIAALLVLMTLLVFTDVLLRFAFDTGFIWIEELTLTFNAWLVLFGMSYGVKVGAHIGVDAFVKILKPNLRKLVAIVAIGLCFCYCLFFIYGSWVYLSKMYEIGITMEDIHLPSSLMSLVDSEFLWQVFRIDVEDPLMPVWLSQSILLIGFSLLLYRFAQLLVKVLRGESDGFRFADEAEESMHLAKGEN